jgi:TM2 domain-containing membrane protein YozV
MNKRFQSSCIIILIFQFIFSRVNISQTDSTKDKNLFSPQNVLSFADFLFCQKDYLRAITEYKQYLQFKNDDSLKFKIGISFLNMRMHKEAEEVFYELGKTEDFAVVSNIEIAKSIFLSRDFLRLEDFYQITDSNMSKPEGAVESIYYYSMLYKDSNLPDENIFAKAFPSYIRSSILDLYYRKLNLSNKSPVLASILSAIIPGAGKIYTEEYSDGITATILTGLLAFLSYDNFISNHKFRGWLWGGLAAFFYAGNIYGSAASAQIYNARINFEFTSDLDLFITKINFFTPAYDFKCK